MKTEYERTNLIITAFDTEDVITTSSVEPVITKHILTENSYGSFGSYDQMPGSWY